MMIDYEITTTALYHELEVFNCMTGKAIIFKRFPKDTSLDYVKTVAVWACNAMKGN